MRIKIDVEENNDQQLEYEPDKEYDSAISLMIDHSDKHPIVNKQLGCIAYEVFGSHSARMMFTVQTSLKVYSYTLLSIPRKYTNQINCVN